MAHVAHSHVFHASTPEGVASARSGQGGISMLVPTAARIRQGRAPVPEPLPSGTHHCLLHCALVAPWAEATCQRSPKNASRASSVPGTSTSRIVEAETAQARGAHRGAAGRGQGGFRDGAFFGVHESTSASRQMMASTMEWSSRGGVKIRPLRRLLTQPEPADGSVRDQDAGGTVTEVPAPKY